jgi:hypothetical protein
MIESDSRLFRVIAGGKEYRVNIDGSIEGFGEDALVFNYYPLRVIEVLEHERVRRLNVPLPAEVPSTRSQS